MKDCFIQYSPRGELSLALYDCPRIGICIVR